MRNLLLIILKYGSTILFLLLEVICFFLIINFNKSQGEIFLHSANLFSGRVNSQIQQVNQFLSLEAQNDSLLRENAKLLETIINYRIFNKTASFQEFENEDSLNVYKFIPSRICSKTVNLRNNHITLCKGALDSIQVGMGVISNNGIVGIVKDVSDNFSHVISILHGQSRISASLKESDFHGTLVWKGSNSRMISLIDLPKHAEFGIGDTIITSGFSTVFPYGVEIGKVETFEIDDSGNNFIVDVELFNNLANLSYVYVVDFPYAEEKEELQLTDEQ